MVMAMDTNHSFPTNSGSCEQITETKQYKKLSISIYCYKS